MNIETFRFVRRSSVVLVTAGLALLCASLVACESHVMLGEPVPAAAQPAQMAAYSLQGMEPMPPFDETPITPAETAGATDDRYLARLTNAVLVGQ